MSVTPVGSRRLPSGFSTSPGVERTVVHVNTAKSGPPNPSYRATHLDRILPVQVRIIP
ncbi:MAG: hypothetical protein ACFFGP_05030 [Promethearchaeota archaeon]